MKANVFVKPDEQNKARFNSAMARKGAMKWNSHSVFATPKIRAVGDPQLNPPIEQRTVAHFFLGFSLKILVDDVIGQSSCLHLVHKRNLQN